jgi:hypothetical protein
MKGLRIFVPEVNLGFAVAKLDKILDRPANMMGIYHLDVAERGRFTDEILRLKDRLGLMYAPTHGVWATYHLPEDRDELELHIGVLKDWGRHLVDACGTLGADAGYLVPAYHARALAIGYLESAGAVHGKR